MLNRGITLEYKVQEAGVLCLRPDYNVNRIQHMCASSLVSSDGTSDCGFFFFFFFFSGSACGSSQPQAIKLSWWRERKVTINHVVSAAVHY